MNIGVKDLLEHSFVISVDENRLKTFRDRFSEYHLDDPLPRTYEGFGIPNGAYKESGFIKTWNLCNCFFSHIALVKMAQSLDWDFICIFEDDAYPCVDCKSKLQNLLLALPDDVDLLKLGHLGSLSNAEVLDENFEITQTFGSHAYVVFKKYYGKYVELSKKDLHIDRLAMNKNDGRKIYSARSILFIQNDTGFGSTLHNNEKYRELLGRQNQLGNFKL